MVIRYNEVDMGLEIVVPRRTPCLLASVLAQLPGAGLTASVAMIDNVLQGPGARVPDVWREVRLRTPAGVVTLRRQGEAISVVVFGNADPALQEAQRKIAEIVRTTP